VKGFKNLKEVDVRFGPFTCIAGGNAVGKSNLFDAISSLLFAERAEQIAGGVRSSSVVFLPLPHTWRADLNPGGKTIQRGQILLFLNPVRDSELDETIQGRVIDRPELHQLKLWSSDLHNSRRESA
jgi:hypothetical protein